MTTPAPWTPPTPTTDVIPSPLVARSYGEPRFHTEGDVAVLPLLIRTEMAGQDKRRLAKLIGAGW